MTCVIMAGGKGTRIASVRSDIPKPMIPVAGKPILEWQILKLKKQGVFDFVFCVGYLGQIIKDYFQDGSKWGVHIDYVVEDTPLGTCGALFYLKNRIKNDFLLVNGDLIFDININRFLEYHKQKGGVATILTHPNSHPYDSGLIVTDKEGKIVRWMTKEEPRTWYHNRVNSGIHMFSPRVFDFFPELKKVDLDREILKPMIPTGQLFAYDSPEYVKDMGTPDRYRQVEADIQSGLVEAKNLSHPQKAIFLDRDGTINKMVGFLRSPDQFELLPGVASAIKKINNSGYLAIVITNQPVIARGEVTFEELDEIHRKMETLLGQEGAYIDDLFFCPHHPDKGFPGEIPELKIDCDCRKPKPGMIFKARDKYHINLSQSYMVGDQKRDEETAINAGCKACRIGKAECSGSESFGSLLECVDDILSH